MNEIVVVPNCNLTFVTKQQQYLDTTKKITMIAMGTSVKLSWCRIVTYNSLPNNSNIFIQKRNNYDCHGYTNEIVMVPNCNLQFVKFPLLVIVAEKCLPRPCLTIDVSSGSIIPAFKRHVTI
jgi:hypothetical protein